MHSEHINPMPPNTKCKMAMTSTEVGRYGRMISSTINRDAVQGNWFERDVSFDASMMRAGENTLTLSIPGGNATNGVEYDYVRLELDEKAAATTTR